MSSISYGQFIVCNVYCFLAVVSTEFMVVIAWNRIDFHQLIETLSGVPVSSKYSCSWQIRRLYVFVTDWIHGRRSRVSG